MTRIFALRCATNDCPILQATAYHRRTTAYIKASANGTMARTERLKYAMETVGISITMAAITTAIAGATMFLAEVLFFQQFGRMRMHIGCCALCEGRNLRPHDYCVLQAHSFFL